MRTNVLFRQSLDICRDLFQRFLFPLAVAYDGYGLSLTYGAFENGKDTLGIAGLSFRFQLHGAGKVLAQIDELCCRAGMQARRILDQNILLNHDSLLSVLCL